MYLFFIKQSILVLTVLDRLYFTFCCNVDLEIEEFFPINVRRFFSDFVKLMCSPVFAFFKISSRSELYFIERMPINRFLCAWLLRKMLQEWQYGYCLKREEDPQGCSNTKGLLRR